MDLFLSDIRVGRPDGSVLFDIPKLEIPSGSHVLIQGASGRGKTTFLHMLAGLFRPERGKVRVGGKELGLLKEPELCDLRRREIGVIFQKLNLIGHLTVEENMALSATRPLTGERVERVLGELRLDGFRSKRCSVLSVGEQQRVAAARVLVQEPALILADEPTSSLDQENAEFLLSALKKTSHGKTLLVVSHDRRIEKEFDRTIRFEDLAR